MKIITTTISMLLVISAYFASAQGLQVSPNTSIKVETGTTLDMTASDLIIESDASGDASLIDLGSVTYSGGGEAKVQRYLTNDAWHLISSPVSNATVEMFTGDFVQYFTESTNTWTDVNSPSYQLQIMNGYALWSMEAAPSTEIFEGATNTGSQQFSFTKALDGFNVLGNPYPSYIDWDQVTIHENLNANFYLYDPTIGELGDYVYYLKNGGANTTTQFIPSGQGFFVQATGSGTQTFDNSVRTHGTQQFFKNEIEQTMLVLKVTGNDVTTQTAIRFIEDATPQIDRLYDIQKIISGNADIPNLYSYAENQKMAINTFSAIKDHEIVPVSFDAGMDGNYSILADELASIPEEVTVLLEDISLNYIQNLRVNPEYTFNYVSGAKRELNVHFKDVTGIESPEAGGQLAVNCYLAKNILYVNFLKDFENKQFNATISVHSITGQQVLLRETSQVVNEIPFDGSQSIYIVSIITDEGIYSTKVYNR